MVLPEAWDPRAEPPPLVHLVSPSAPAWCASDGRCLGNGRLMFSAGSAQGRTGGSSALALLVAMQMPVEGAGISYSRNSPALDCWGEATACLMAVSHRQNHRLPSPH